MPKISTSPCAKNACVEDKYNLVEQPVMHAQACQAALLCELPSLFQTSVPWLLVAQVAERNGPLLKMLDESDRKPEVSERDFHLLSTLLGTLDSVISFACSRQDCGFVGNLLKIAVASLRSSVGQVAKNGQL